jgi:hypothetical protein
MCANTRLSQWLRPARGWLLSRCRGLGADDALPQHCHYQGPPPIRKLQEQAARQWQVRGLVGRVRSNWLDAQLAHLLRPAAAL